MEITESVTTSDPIILHHFDASPFAEKVRLAFGLKNVPWQSVDIPMVMPKPMLTALTGGYRKTPVMQIGADIYCDTQCIALELERRIPAPSLFPDDSVGLCLALSHWSDVVFFRPGAALSMGTNEGLPEAVLRDRQAFFTFLDFETLRHRLPHFYSQYRAQLQLLENMLADGRSYILGEHPAWADVVAYFPLWMGRGNIEATGQLLESLPAVKSWEARMQSVGHGQRERMSAEEALQLAGNSISQRPPCVEAGTWPQSLSPGDTVTVCPEDYGTVPVSGALHILTQDVVAIRREHPELGELVVHFPRTGYEVTPG